MSFDLLVLAVEPAASLDVVRGMHRRPGGVLDVVLGVAHATRRGMRETMTRPSGIRRGRGHGVEDGRLGWQCVPMGFMDRLLRRTSPLDEASEEVAQRTTPVQAIPSQTGEGVDLPDRWYAPQDGNPDRFVGADGLPTLRLIPYRDTGGEYVLRLCEDDTGLLVGPTDRRLPRAGIYVSQLRGEAHHQAECRAGNFHPGEPVRLVRERENPYDSNAVAVYDATGQYRAAYINKQKARMLAKVIDSGTEIEAISIRGTRSGVGCDQVAVLAASPDVLRHLLGPRPADAPRPAHER